MKQYTIKYENGKLSINGRSMFNTSSVLYYLTEQHNIHVNYIYEKSSNDIKYYIISKDDCKKEINIMCYEYWQYYPVKQKYLIKRDIKKISKIIDKFYKNYNYKTFIFDVVVK